MTYQLRITFGDYNSGDFQKSKKISKEKYNEFLPLMKDIMEYGRTKNKFNLSSDITLEYNHATCRYGDQYCDYNKYKDKYSLDEFNEFMNFIHPNKGFDSVIKFELLETKVVDYI